MKLYLERSRPRKAFKTLLGNANHLIITALVGLDGVERGVVSGVPKDLRTVWSPKDPKNSAKRSRRLILDMALIRAIDAIDTYLREAIRKPALIQSNDFRADLDAAGSSIFAKLQSVERFYPKINGVTLAVVFVMVAWRNRAAHTEADRDAPEKHLAELRSNSVQIAENFSGLDVEMLLGGYEAIRPVTFKEVASLNKAAQCLVADLDARLLNSLDCEQFLKDVIWSSLSVHKKPIELVEETRKRRAISVWGKDPNSRMDAIIRLLRQNGFSEIQPEKRVGAIIPEELLLELKRHNPKSIIKWACPHN